MVLFIFKFCLQGTDSFNLRKSLREILIRSLLVYRWILLKIKGGVVAPSPTCPGAQWFLNLTFLFFSPRASTALTTCCSASLHPLLLSLLLGFLVLTPSIRLITLLSTWTPIQEVQQTSGMMCHICRIAFTHCWHLSKQASIIREARP